jgi:prophage maintenance system killer protein
LPIDPNAIRYFTVEELVELHTAVSSEFGGRNSSPGVVESQFGLVRAVQVPQSTFLGREAYPDFCDKAAVLYWGILQNKPFNDSNAALALAALSSFCEMNGAKIDDKVLDEKGLEKLTKKSASLDEAPEKVFGTIRGLFRSAIRR